jgi:hypothetical protein
MPEDDNEQKPTPDPQDTSRMPQPRDNQKGRDPERMPQPTDGRRRL